MKLSPLDVRKQEFSRAVRGYDADEVRAFLQTIAGQMEDLIDEQLRAQSELEEFKGKMGHLEHVQEALQTTLEMARQNSEDTRKAALKKAEMIIHEAHLKGEEILKRGELDVRKTRDEIARMEAKREELFVRFRAMLEAEIQLLDRFKPEPKTAMKESDMEMASLEYVDPAARAHGKRKQAAAAAEAPAPESKTDEEDDKPSVEEVVAELKASVEAVDDDSDDKELARDGEMGDMQKIRQILDDLE
ncbi:MAG TPA: DivIVA domain-containing protein [Rhodothermales bacterium]|nr:DivIVA domain-containing protein [Rhodothermales bacterium]